MSLAIPDIYYHTFLPKPNAGHTAVFYNGIMIIHGGFGELPPSEEETLDDFGFSSFYSEKCLWCYDVELSKWFFIGTVGDHPDYYHSDANARVLGDSMIIFAGNTGLEMPQNTRQMTSTVYELDLNSCVWTNLTEKGFIEGPTPSERQDLASWVYEKQIIYFGGFCRPLTKENETNGEFCRFRRQHLEGWTNGICILDFSEDDRIKWKYPEVKGQKPLPRAAHACTEIGNRGFVFGGRWKNQRLNDMFWLDLDTFEWHMIEYKSIAPCGRSWHSLNRLSNDRILLYGGIDTDGHVLSDMWIFNITESTWNEIQDVHSRLREFAPRVWHTAVNTHEEGEVVIFGGGTSLVLGEPQNCNTVAVFRANPRRLKHLCIEKVVEYWPILSRRYLLPASELRIIERHLKTRGIIAEDFDDSDDSDDDLHEEYIPLAAEFFKLRL